MAALDHWHPAAPLAEVSQRPVGVTICGQQIALFRTASGEVAALDDVCPHRRMRLSKGKVVGERLQCAYHGWSFDACGNGESPGTPKLHACGPSFDAREAHGYVWVKPRGVNATLPTFPANGYHFMCHIQHRVKANLEVTLDNFCEIEHTPTTHAIFGYELDRMHEVQVRFEPTDTTVRVVNQGPPKRFNPVLSALIGIRKGDLFYDDWTTHFSPVYSVYDHWWGSPDGTRTSRIKWRLFMFFTPVTEAETRITTWAYMSSTYPLGPYNGTLLFRGFLRRNLDHEIGLDVAMVESLADPNPSIEGLKLSRFDRVLGLNRERINRVYRGEPATRLRLASV